MQVHRARSALYWTVPGNSLMARMNSCSTFVELKSDTKPRTSPELVADLNDSVGNFRVK